MRRCQTLACLTQGGKMLVRASYRAGLVLLSTAALLVTPGGALNGWMSAAKLAAQSAPAAPRPNDGDLPRGYSTPDGSSIVIYQPQIADWVDQKLMNLYAAVSYTPRGANTPILGTIRAQADPRVSVEERLVDFSSLRIEQSNFPGATREQATAAVAAIKSGMQPGERVIALDRVLESFDASTIRPKNIEGVKADPPILFYSTRPAIIINLDGDPIWSPIQNNDSSF